jgi:tetratricopeptide (TPR) repeat protein
MFTRLIVSLRAAVTALLLCEPAVAAHASGDLTETIHAGRAVFARGDYAGAEQIFMGVLAQAEKTEGPSALLAVALHNLGSVRLKQGRLLHAEPLLVRSVAVWEALPTAARWGLAASFDAVADLRRLQGRHADAESLLARSLALKEQTLGPSHPSVREAALQLADVSTAVPSEQAEALYRDVVSRAPITADSVTWLALNNLATLVHQQGRPQEAESLFRKALDLAEQANPRDVGQIAGILWNLAQCSVAQDEPEEAASFHARTLAMLDSTPGASALDTARTLNGLAQVRETQGQVQEAIQLYRRAIAVTEDGPGSLAKERARALNNLGALYGAQGRSSEAEHLYLRALAALETLPSVAEADLAAVLTNLAAAAGKDGRSAQAHEYQRRAHAYLRASRR